MKVVILCGGFGTRIRDVAEDIPKPMIPVGPFPILWHIMKYYASYGFNEFVLCLGYKGKNIKDFFLNYEYQTTDFTIKLGESPNINVHSLHDEKGWSITFAETGLKALTGTRVRRIKKYIPEGESFHLTYGDGLSDVNIDKLLAYHKNHGKTLTLTGVRPAGRFGELGVDSNGAVIEFNEKPQATAGRINGGYFVCNYKLFDVLSDSEDLIFEKEPMGKLVRNKELMQFPHDGFWQPMDTYREFSLLNELYKTNKAPWKIWN